MQAPEKTEESAQATDSDHAETEEKPGSRHKTDHKKTGRNPGFLITVIAKQENKVCS